MSGSALKHWIYVRASALAAIPFTLWLVWSFVAGNVTADHAAFTSWLSQPLHALAVILAVVIVFSHTSSGAQEMIEDYVHHETLKKYSIRALHGFFLLAGVLCVYNICKIAFGG